LGIVEEVEITRYQCKRCQRIFSATYEDAPPKGHFHYEIIWAAVDLAAGLTESLRNAEMYLNAHFKAGVSHTDIAYWIRKSGECLEEVRTKLVPLFSGYLGIDELHLNLNGQKIYVLGYSDAKTHAFLDFDIVYGKDAQSYAESITRFLASHPLKAKIKAVITDEFSTFVSIIPKIFPNCAHQRCIFHAKGNINKRVYSAAKVSFRKALPREYRDLKDILDAVFEASTQEHSKYWLYIARAVQIRHGLEKDKAISKLLQNLEQKLESLTHYLEDPDCPKTNNATEQIWSIIRPRKEIMKCFRSEKSIKNYFNILQTAINFKAYKNWCQIHPKEAEALPFQITVEYWFQYIKFPSKKNQL
jgi:transposase-like protein